MSALTPRLTPYIPHVPHPPQQAFLLLSDLGVEEALYGGAAGGGKSDALLMAALQYVDVPGYAAILFRRTFADLRLPGALIPRSKEWLLKTDASWNDNAHQWTFPSGATVSFGYLHHADDELRYQGTEFQFVGFDELTQLPEQQYRYLRSRLRRPDDGPLARVPLRARAASNPGGPGHRWVRSRFIEKAVDPLDEEDTPEKAAARVFIPAKVADNPSIDREAYERQLAALPPQLRAQLRNGDWNAREPGDWIFQDGLDEVFALGRLFDEQRAAKRMRPPVGGELALGADFGVHTHVLAGWPLEAGGWYVPREVVNDVASLKGVGRRAADMLKALRYPCYSERFDASMPGLNDVFLTELREHVPTRVKFLGIPFGKFKALTIGHLELLVGNALLRVRYPEGAGLADLPEAALRSLARQLGEKHEPDDATVDEIVGTLVERAKAGPVLAISETGCPRLADQIRRWKYADPDVGRVEKGDDHGPDALVALDAPVAAKRHRR